MSVNSRILGAASCVFQVSIQDSQRHPLSRPSASTLNTINEYGTDMNGLGGKQLSQLDVGQQFHLANHFLNRM
jgi:hypothetical protein